MYTTSNNSMDIQDIQHQLNVENLELNLNMNNIDNKKYQFQSLVKKRQQNKDILILSALTKRQSKNHPMIDSINEAMNVLNCLHRSIHKNIIN